MQLVNAAEDGVCSFASGYGLRDRVRGHKGSRKDEGQVEMLLYEKPRSGVQVYALRLRKKERIDSCGGATSDTSDQMRHIDGYKQIPFK